MKYRAELLVGGRIAAVGQRLLDAAAKHMTRLGLEALTREREARLAGGGGGAP
jgi:carbon monoxide dehydrogenase subunit G